MPLLFARQPIFDKKNSIYGYELLYRDEAANNSFNNVDGDMATSNVMAAGFLSMGVSSIAGKKKAFINFTHNMLLQKVATLFPSDQIVVELLETIEPTKEIIDACKSLKSHGYTLALDDFIFKPGYEPLIEQADVIKVDFILTKSENERKYIVNHFGNGRIRFLAEKIETIEEYHEAVRLGYTYYQGYYFSKPMISQSKEIPPAKINHLKLMHILQENDPKFEDIVNVIEKDVAFSYEILKIANTAYYYRGNSVKSIRQASMRMGLDELRKWAYITVLRKIGDNNKDEIVVICAQRAKAMEFISRKIGLEQRKTELFTMGMLSMIDTLTGCMMDLILSQLDIPKDIKEVLSGKLGDDKVSLCYKLITSYEKGEWNTANSLCEKLGIKVEDIADAYFKAIVWVNCSDCI
ncbi:EAL and HDOD domain-containing protein [Pseudobacteroides cellulosolvens]|uniref:Diguanylate phosphodiesterase metal dependent hydrolase domain containing protein n=1 Tax=Pseudobacteroides cellulosolvens ATCC 35603 = DSM 2933 TaxID=398512 RepID=A0A0L6JL78_9FIRM|nr:HDOD domain-containing protein [Pseudobacteroides cellulosolvens]KNY26529.1 diguanylate phosphodiesterase metal dependent hydrolase domain containing protein [Pseudobacteroides cellulosolvens ATCC 35603 = DSM 2933]